jgi:uncharacterized protein DUF6519
MKGDFSRLRYNRAKHYTSVLQQQGRVALDADANEQCSINEDIRGTETIDIVGPFGGPAADPGFAITVAGNTVQIGAGRYYVEGLLCENPSSLGYMQQPYLIDPPFSDSRLLSDLQSGASSAIQVFLEVWQRLVTSLDDPCLLEPALGLADTTARLQTVWRVVAQEVAPTSPPNKFLPRAFAFQTVDRLPLPLSSEIAGLAAAPAPATSAPAAPSASTGAAPPDCCVAMYQQPKRLLRGRLNAQTSGAASGGSCQPTPAAGYRGLENQLYRVEIHQGGTETTATFKWSRENGSVVTGVTGASGSQVLVESLGFDANLGYATGQWVEISDDTGLFGVPSNQPGQLYQIQSTTPGQLSLTVAPPVTGVDPTRNARLRRWDQFGSSAGPRGVPVSTSWIDLENGIQVQFSAGNYVTGDYWLIPARTASGEIDWPPCGGNGWVQQEPYEIEIFRAPLACIHWGTNQQFSVEDCRRLFPPLTQVAGGAASALHVTKINWSNDDVLAFDQLLATGLTVSLDQAATAHIDASTFGLTLEVPVVSKIEPTAIGQSLAPIVLRTANLLDGQITVQNTNITWNIPFRDSRGAIAEIQLEALVVLDLMLLQGLSYNSYARARVRLQGRNIFAGTGSTQAFLDGQTFGTAGVRADGLTPRTDLTFPSGGDAKASDFESWFFLAPTLTLASLTVAPAAVTFTPTAPTAAAPVATLTVNYPALADTVVTLSVVSPAGIPSGVTVPATVKIPRGGASVTFSVGVKNTSTSTAEAFQIVASLTNALGITGTVTATLTITGFVIIQ